MVSNENAHGQTPTAVRRTEGYLKRRQALADAATGIPAGEVDAPAEAAKFHRFRCVVYLCGAPNANIEVPRRECTAYAKAFGWEIAGVVEDHAGLLPPDGREGLRQAVDRIKGGEAGAVLTAWRSMISPVPQEYDQVTREIETAGGFLHVMDSAGAEDALTRGETTK
ncbi:hypothetical protein [Streptomyces sp. NPDC054765]